MPFTVNTLGMSPGESTSHWLKSGLVEFVTPFGLLPAIPTTKTPSSYAASAVISMALEATGLQSAPATHARLVVLQPVGLHGTQPAPQLHAPSSHPHEWFMMSTFRSAAPNSAPTAVCEKALASESSWHAFSRPPSTRHEACRPQNTSPASGAKPVARFLKTAPWVQPPGQALSPTPALSA